MVVPVRTGLLGIILAVSTMPVYAGFDGIYRGRTTLLLSSGGGKLYYADATLVVMPDLKSAILTTTFPTGALSAVIRGRMHGNTFIGRSEGKLQTGGYHYAMNYRIKFVGDKAYVDGVPIHDAYWAKGASRRHEIEVFRKVSK